MKKQFIYENESINLEKSDISTAKDLLKKNPELPFKIEGISLNFAPYTIGQIQLKDTIIEIIPRNHAFTLKNFFEMILFTDSKKFESNIFTSTYDHDSSFGIRTLGTHFCNMCENLLKIGLTGYIENRVRTSMSINGNILFENFHKAKIPIEGIKIIEGQYTLDVLPNQIIKSALKKLLLTESDSRMVSRIISILKEFDSINEYIGSYEIAEDNIRKFFSSNRYYPISLEYAIRILKDVKISCKNGNIEWSAFLQNSNTVFEQYVRKILEIGLDEHVEKFKEEKNYAVIRYEDKDIARGYSPDILIGYDQSTDSCMAVFDVKNKEFSSNEIKSKKVPSSADIYQLSFYCKRLKTSLGGLIYPSSENLEPLMVSIDDENELMFLLVSINMNENIRIRHEKLINTIREQILTRS